jgi:hypothetical protein
MKPLFSFLFVLMLAGSTFARTDSFDSIVIEITDLPIDHWHYYNGDEKRYEFNGDFRLVLRPTLDTIYDGKPFFINEAGKVGVHFTPDTIHITSLEYFYLHGRETYTEFECVSAACVSTTSTIEADMDSAQLAQTTFRYKDYYHYNESGGRHWFEDDTANGKLLTTTRIKITFFKSLPADVDEDDPVQQLSWHPNPASKRVTFRSELSADVTVYDLHGRTVLSVRATEDDLDVSVLDPGIYLLRSGHLTQKLVIQH